MTLLGFFNFGMWHGHEVQGCTPLSPATPASQDPSRQSCQLETHTPSPHTCGPVTGFVPESGGGVPPKASKDGRRSNGSCRAHQPAFF